MIRLYTHRIYRWIAPILLVMLAAGCGGAASSNHTARCRALAKEAPSVDPRSAPPGWSVSLTTVHDGVELRFGHIHGHYWRWLDETTICGLHYNTDQIHASQVEDGRLLYFVEGKLVSLDIPDDQMPQPTPDEPVIQILTGDVPLTWLGPPMPDGYVYWHGTYDTQNQASPIGFWLRHTALLSFFFDMGGEPGYPFIHEVRPGIDHRYAPKLNFDRGPL